MASRSNRLSRSTTCLASALVLGIAGAAASSGRAWADAMAQPQCGGEAPFETREWFERGEALRSFAFMPLRTAQTFGVLALASEDPDRYRAGVGTVYLVRLAELASVATARYLPLG